jgi:GTPase KRas protein
MNHRLAHHGTDTSAAVNQQIRQGQGFMIVYAVNNKKSFEKLEEYREAILNIKDSQNYPLVMIGNKCDLEVERKVSTDEGHALAKSFGCPFFETSAKSRTNVDEAFFEVCIVFQKQKQKATEQRTYAAWY